MFFNKDKEKAQFNYNDYMIIVQSVMITQTFEKIVKLYLKLKVLKKDLNVLVSRSN